MSKGKKKEEKKEEWLEIGYTEDFEERHVDDVIVTHLPVSGDILIDIIKFDLKVRAKGRGSEVPVNYQGTAKIQLRLVMNAKVAKRFKDKLSNALKRIEEEQK